MTLEELLEGFRTVIPFLLVQKSINDDFVSLHLTKFSWCFFLKLPIILRHSFLLTKLQLHGSVVDTSTEQQK